MNRRIVSAIITICGFAVIVAVVCLATVGRPSATVQAKLSTATAQHYIYVEPGVLGIVNADVTVTASATGKPVTLAVAYSADARSWLADDPYLSVTGLRNWNTLSSTAVTQRCAQSDASASASASASATQASASAAATVANKSGCTTLTDSNADPAQADIWQLIQTKQNSITLELDATDPDLVLIAATDGASAAPTITLSWPRSVSMPWLIPGLIVGGVLILAGVFTFLLDLQERHAAAQRRQRAAERAARIANADLTATLGIPAIADPHRPLTRREQRDKERAQADGKEWLDPRTGKVFLAGVEVTATRADETDSLQTVLAAAGVTRGSAVVPSLDAQTTEKYRAMRQLADESALLLVPEAHADADDAADNADDASDESAESSVPDTKADSADVQAGSPAEEGEQ